MRRWPTSCARRACRAQLVGHLRPVVRGRRELGVGLEAAHVVQARRREQVAEVAELGLEPRGYRVHLRPAPSIQPPALWSWGTSIRKSHRKPIDPDQDSGSRILTGGWCWTFRFRATAFLPPVADSIVVMFRRRPPTGGASRGAAAPCASSPPSRRAPACMPGPETTVFFIYYVIKRPARP